MQMGPVRILVVLVAALAAVAVAPRAHAASGVRYGLTDDAWLTNGPGTLTSRVATLRATGVGVVRYTLRWDQIARSKPAAAADPEDPAYDWSAPAEGLDALHAGGVDVLLQLVGTPSWANGG